MTFIGFNANFNSHLEQVLENTFVFLLCFGKSMYDSASLHMQTHTFKAEEKTKLNLQRFPCFTKLIDILHSQQQ